MVASNREGAFNSIFGAVNLVMTIKTRLGNFGRSSTRTGVSKRKPGPLARPIVEFPDPLFSHYDDPSEFQAALSLQMARHGDTCWSLFRAVVSADETLDVKTIFHWKRGDKSPRAVESLKILQRIERRYRLPEGYFKAKLPNRVRSATGHSLIGIGSAERRRLAWHLPDDFDRRTPEEKAEILFWVRSVILSGSTEYRRFQAKAIKHRYAVRFADSKNRVTPSAIETDQDDERGVPTTIVSAPPRLASEMADLLDFKTATLSAAGFQRNGVWGEATAQQKTEHLGLMFGAMVASPKSVVRGLGICPQKLTFGLLAFPAVWDWYLNWRERRRGFFTAWEIDMLRVGLALTRKDTGWIWQNPHLADRLTPISKLISGVDIRSACRDWSAACESFQKHASNRVKEIQRVARVHRDPFEPILPILEAESPLGEYRKIADEVWRLLPNERVFPVAAAEAVRSYLLLRFGMHLGVRQKNLRQLLVSRRGQAPRTERMLVDLRRGELRWSDRDEGWEVIIPSIAFKNADSSYFGNRPFRLKLPDVGGFYDAIQMYLDRHRNTLLKGAADPGTLFVKTVKRSSANAEYDQNSFYEAWRLTIQRYGIFNPYTGRGAIKGLLPHGPHSIRDVLATHILKRTGSYEQASYAIQDTPSMVAKHYGRFLPQDKAAIAAQILNKVWNS